MTAKAQTFPPPYEIGTERPIIMNPPTERRITYWNNPNPFGKTSKPESSTEKLKINPEFEMRRVVKTWYATLHIAGDINTAKAFIRKHVAGIGSCYQVAECDYLYTGGAEAGLTVRAIHYPRFKEKTPDIILGELLDLAFGLVVELGQKSFTIETSEKTYYYDNGTK